MKRTLAAALIVISFAVSTLAAGTRRYVVGVRPQRSRMAIASRALTPASDGVAPLASRNFSDFKYLDSFAADLTDDEAAALRQQPDVTFVEASMTVHALGIRLADVAQTSAPAGPRATSTQTTPWGISAVHAPDTWIVTRGDHVNVAVLDTGIDYNHADLQGRYVGGYNFVAVPNTADPKDDNGHGTHVAGIIAADDNALGVVGVAPNANIWSVKILDKDGSGSTPSIAAGINWVISKKAEIGGNWIINMSLGIPACTSTKTTDCASAPPLAMVTACQKAADAGVLIFAAAGNESSTGAPAPVGYPAAISTVVAVGAIDALQNVASFSDQGPEVAMVAPGVFDKSTWPTGTGSDTHLASQDGTFVESIAMDGSPSGTITGQLVFCGLGTSPADFPAAVRGNIALIQRGDITFGAKTKNAVAAGATAVAIFNKETGPFLGTLIGTDPADKTYPWPLAVSLSLEDGQKLTGLSSSATITNSPGDYQYESGTSMASPHAAGVAALVWSAAPSATANDVRAAMINTAHDLGASGQDPVFGFGLVDAYLAAKSIAPQLFIPQPSTGRRILRRGH